MGGRGGMGVIFFHNERAVAELKESLSREDEWSHLLTVTGQCRGDVMGIECNGPCTGFEHQGTGQRPAAAESIPVFWGSRGFTVHAGEANF